MIGRRKGDKSQPVDPLEAGDGAVEPAAADAGTGPWDVAERPDSDEPDYIDLGGLRVKGREGVTMQLPTDDKQGTIGSVVFLHDKAGLEVRAFAARRSGGLWDEVRADIVTQVTGMSGTAHETDGPYGPELQVRVPAKTSEGQDGTQESRIVGIDGARWMVRATFLGEVETQADESHVLKEVLQDLVVVRGDNPLAPRSPLTLTLPDDAVRLP